MIKGETSTGFHYEINEAVLNDYEMLELMAELEENPLRTPVFVKRLLGLEQKNRLVKHVKKATGSATIEAVQAELLDILSAKPLKNS